MIKVTHTCTKTPGTNCPLCQYNDDGTPRCAGCINARLNFKEATNEAPIGMDTMATQYNGK